jgi:hypothetical protein
MPIVNTQNIQLPTAPALPVAPIDYSQGYISQLNNVLRLYFNRIDNAVRFLMSNQAPYGVYFAGSSSDAFGRGRISQPYTLFDSQNRYADSGDFDTVTANGGTATFSMNTSSMLLAVTTASGSSVTRESYRVFPYQPGKSLLVMCSLVMNAGQTGLRQRVGYFSTQNGIFLEQDGTTVYMVKRSYVSGVVVDTRVAQKDWNGDPLNGLGVSGEVLDISKSQLLWFDFEWLGVGSVRCGFIINGVLVVCHTFTNSNENANVYMTTAILPVRYEITNTAGTAAAATLKQVCCTVVSEGGYERKVAASVIRMTSAVSVGTSFYPLISFKLASDRLDAVVLPDGHSVLPLSAGNYEVVLVKNATLTGASYNTTDFPNVDYDLSATAYTGGTIVSSEFITASNQATSPGNVEPGYNFDLQLGRTMAGVSDVYTLAVRSLAGSNNVIASFQFFDLT